MRQFAVLLFCPFVLGAADKNSKPELPPAVRPIVDLARAASSEMFVETILQLVESGKIPLREHQIDLLEEAFAVAPGAKEPVRLIAIPATPPDTRAMYRSKAGELNWDTLSLESRIATDLLTIDRKKARELFDHIARPVLDPRPCEDPLVADVSAYYEVAGKVAQLGFTSDEKAKEEDVQFLATVLAGARSPNELAPFARAMKSVGLTPPQRQLLSSALAAKLQSVGPDYRAFAMSRADLSEFIAPDAFASYRRAQLSAARCQPDFADAEDDVQPSSRGAVFKAEPYFQSEDSRQIGETLNRLRAQSNSASPESRNQLADFLRDFSAWTPPGSSVDAFHQRATVFRALLEFVPAGDDRERILSLAVSFLESSDAEREAPAEWMYQVKTVLDSAHSMLDHFRTSSSVGLNIYVYLR